MRPQTHVPRRGAVFLLGLARTLALCLLTYFGSGFFAAQAAESRLPAAQETRLRELTRELRCLVCQNESLAESHAPLAADLREEIREQIRAGKADSEVVQYLVARYGDFVTYKPPFNARTALLWLGPFAVLLLLLSGLWSFSRRSRKLPGGSHANEEIQATQEVLRRLKRQYENRDD